MAEGYVKEIRRSRNRVFGLIKPTRGNMATMAFDLPDMGEASKIGLGSRVSYMGSEQSLRGKPKASSVRALKLKR